MLKNIAYYKQLFTGQDPIGKLKKTQELRGIIQQDTNIYSINEIFNFVRSRPELRDARDPYGGQSFRSKDAEYYVVSRSTVEQIINETEVDTIEWVADKTDCDDIAKYFSALMSVRYGLNSFGVATSYDGGHAFSFALIHEGGKLNVVWFEPQTDEILTDKIGHGAYQLGPGWACFNI